MDNSELNGTRQDATPASGSIKGVNLIIYVADQAMAARFYTFVLDQTPSLDVPGMTEFELPGGAGFGLMPIAGIHRLLGDALTDQEWQAHGPRGELYITVDNASAYFQRAIDAGARELSSIQMRSWGQEAGYLLDPDGHILAFANPMRMTN